MNVIISRSLLVCFIFIGFFLTTSCSPTKRSSANRKYSQKRSKSKSKTKSRKTISAKKINDALVKNNRQRKSIIVEAKKYKGIPYVYGGKTPKGFDCSGFTSYVYAKKGVKLQGSSRDQATLGKKISLKNVKPGDLLFFGNSKGVSHVGMISNVGPELIEIIHSTKSRGVVQENIFNSTYWKKKFLFARDILSFRS